MPDEQHQRERHRDDASPFLLVLDGRDGEKPGQKPNPTASAFG